MMQRMPIVLVAAVILLLALQYSLWFSPNGLLHVHRLEHDMSILREKNKALAKSNHQLANDVHRLKHDPTMIAQKARDNYAMIKPGETYYNLVGS